MLDVCKGYQLCCAVAAANSPGITHGRTAVHSELYLQRSHNAKSSFLHCAGGDRLLRRMHSPASKLPPAPDPRHVKNVRCSTGEPLTQKAAKVAAPASKLGPELPGNVELELSITKAPTYVWPPQHMLELRLVSTSLKAHPGPSLLPDKEVVSSPAIVFIPPGEASIKLRVDVALPAGFGMPGALLLNSFHPQEFFLESVSWSYLPAPENRVGRIYKHFWCNSWVTQTSPSQQPRIFFANQVFLPNHTPRGLSRLRQVELGILKGDGTGRRHLGERIYDYDLYNDLGNPDADPEMKRPVLGGSSDLPYPRRCRTGRERTATDPASEAPDPEAPMYYVPRDEQFSATKQAIMSRNVGQVMHAAALHLRADWESAAARKAQEIPTFETLEEIFRLYGASTFPWPPILQDKDAWWTDEEFGRQRLAGLNPLTIERVKAFPLMSSLDPEAYGPPTSAITAHHVEPNLEGLTVEEAVDQKRIFALDYHDALLPVLDQVNSSGDTKVYATRTLFFLTVKGNLKPIAIELSSPPVKGQRAPQNRVFTPPAEAIDDFPGDDESAWLWQLAKAHVAVNDTGYHQLISHWLRTHCTLEPFVIATHRQLSALHPINRLLLPHFKDTMSINGQARKNLINSRGVIESTFFPRQLSMQFSSIVYKNWRFVDQGLPQDLIKRGMAEMNPKNELTLAITNYPYAVDGLELWAILQSWVQDYVGIYYQDDRAVQDDTEIQAWWSEIKNVGHGDHRKAEWWGAMDSKKELEQALLTIIWLASGHHAAVNFGQYAYAGFMPNSPSVARRAVPETSDPISQDLQDLRNDPEGFFLSSLATHQEAMAVMATLQLLSTHIEEEFLGEAVHAHLTPDAKPTAAFRKFTRALRALEANIEARNKDPGLVNNRQGLAKMSYKLLFPSSEQGLTFQGVPNSIAI